MNTPNGNPGYEISDADARSIWKFIAGLFVLIAVASLAMVLLFRFLYRSEQASMPAPTPMETRRVIPPSPRLQIDGTLDLDSMRLKENAELNSYGWIDQNAGVVRIPIGRAIELIAQRGLPKTPAAGTKPAARAQANPAAAAKPTGGNR